MSIQLTGSALIIKGRNVVNSKGDVFANNLSAHTIAIKSGGVNIKGDSKIDGDLLVNGDIKGKIKSITSCDILNKSHKCLVEIVAKCDDDDYITFSGVFITSDGWVLTSSSANLIDVWGTILNPTKDKDIDVVKAHHIFVDKLNGLCVIKFPDIEDHPYLKWANDASLQLGERCYFMTSGTHPFSQSSIREGTVYNTHLETMLYDCTVYDFGIFSETVGQCIVNENRDLVGILSFILPEYKMPGSLCTKLAKQSVHYMISNLKDYESEYKSSLGIIKYTNVTHLEIITNGLLGMFPPKGKIIDKLNDDSPLTLCDPKIIPGDLITHINNIELTSTMSINSIISNHSIGTILDIAYITPPSITPKKTRATLVSMEGIDKGIGTREIAPNLSILKELEPKTITKQIYVEDFEQTNNKNAQIIYEATHEKQIKYRKKMYLADRLRTIKNRKKSKKRVVSRRKSKGR